MKQFQSIEKLDTSLWNAKIECIRKGLQELDHLYHTDPLIAYEPDLADSRTDNQSEQVSIMFPFFSH